MFDFGDGKQKLLPVDERWGNLIESELTSNLVRNVIGRPSLILILIRQKQRNSISWLRLQRSTARSMVALSIALLGKVNTATVALLYSVDLNTDELVSVESSNGQVSVVGSLGRDAKNISLAFLGGQLFGLDSDFVSQRAELIEIDPFTGAASLLGTVFSGVDQVTLAEGMTSRSGVLQASFTTTPNDPRSDSLGELSLSGQLTNSTFLGLDMDGLATDASGQIFAIDGDPTPNTNSLFTILPTSLLGATDRSIAGRISGINFLGDDLLGITSDLGTLSRLSTTDGSLLGTISLSQSRNYSGLANVPEPSSFALASLAAVSGLLLHGRRIRSRFAAR